MIRPLLLTIIIALCAASHHDDNCDNEQHKHKRRAVNCDNGWTGVRRKSGGWCIAVFNGALTHDQSLSKCKEMGATLTSIENKRELKLITKLGSAQANATSKWDFGSVRIGLRRDNNNSPFYWTDGNIRGDGVRVWSPEEPRNINPDLNCAQVWIKHTTVPDAFAYRKHGTMFVVQCNPAWDDKYRGYACGKKAV